MNKSSYDAAQVHASIADIPRSLDPMTESTVAQTECVPLGANPTTHRRVTDSPTLWFMRGMALGMLVVGSLNAVSYFFRSSSWGSLVGRAAPGEESLGFPFIVWESGNTYDGWFADYSMLALNALCAAVTGSLLGWWAARRSGVLNRWIESILVEIEPDVQRPVQFSLKGLMIATMISAVVATLARHYAARPETLIGIYALGPALLVAIAMLPRHLSWQKRVMIIVPAAYALIAAAIAVGVGIGMEFDKVLMGIFLCWTPQSALAAAALVLVILISRAYRDTVMVEMETHE